MSYDFTHSDAREILEFFGINGNIESIGGSLVALVVTNDGNNALVSNDIGVFHCPNWAGAADNEYETELTEYPFNAESIARVIRDIMHLITEAGA